jgi:ribosome-binding protein aMBF1 (putative translation factor)
MRDRAHERGRTMTELTTTLERIAHTVRDERRRQQMDQRTLALVANVAVRSVSRIENAQATVRLDVLLRVIAALGLRLDVHPPEPA